MSNLKENDIDSMDSIIQNNTNDDMDNIESRVVSLLATRFDRSNNEITGETDLVADLGADSLDLVEMMISIEGEFGVTVPDKEASSMKTVNDIVKYISSIKSSI